MYIDVCLRVHWQPLSRVLSPSLKNASGTKKPFPPSAPEHRPCSRCLTGAEGKHQRHHDTCTWKHFWCVENGPLCGVQKTAQCQQNARSPTGGNNTSQVQMILQQTKHERQPPKALLVVCLDLHVVLTWSVYHAIFFSGDGSSMHYITGVRYENAPRKDETKERGQSL